MAVLKMVLFIALELLVLPLLKLLNFVHGRWGWFPRTRARLRHFYYRRIRLFIYGF